MTRRRHCHPTVTAASQPGYRVWHEGTLSLAPSTRRPPRTKEMRSGNENSIAPDGAAHNAIDTTTYPSPFPRSPDPTQSELDVLGRQARHGSTPPVVLYRVRAMFGRPVARMSEPARSPRRRRQSAPLLLGEHAPAAGRGSRHGH